MEKVEGCSVSYVNLIKLFTVFFVITLPTLAEKLAVTLSEQSFDLNF